MAKMFGGGTAGRKIAQYILAVRRGNLDADLDLLPTDKYEIEERAEKETESGQDQPARRSRCGEGGSNPAQKEQTVQTAAKTKPDTVVNPLEENEIEGGNGEESSQDQSKSVKVGQTDPAPISPIRPTGPASPTRPTSPSENSEARGLQRVIVI
jgi:hypothetical protein